MGSEVTAAPGARQPRGSHLTGPGALGLGAPRGLRGRSAGGLPPSPGSRSAGAPFTRGPLPAPRGAAPGAGRRLSAGAAPGERRVWGLPALRPAVERAARGSSARPPPRLAAGQGHPRRGALPVPPSAAAALAPAGRHHVTRRPRGTRLRDAALPRHCRRGRRGRRALRGHGTARCGSVRYGTARYGSVRPGMSRRGGRRLSGGSGRR